MMPCSTSTVASGMPMRRWIRPPAAAMRAEQDGDRHDRQRVMPGEEGDEDAGEAVAGDQRGIGLAVDGGDLEEAGEAGAGAGDDAADDHQQADRQALRLARRAALPPVMRAAKPKVVRLISTQSTMARTMPAARPQCTSVPGIEPTR